jgi:hypothetical protein
MKKAGLLLQRFIIRQKNEYTQNGFNHIHPGYQKGRDPVSEI